MSLCSLKDSNLIDDPFCEDASVIIRLLPAFDEHRGEDFDESSMAEDVLGASDVGDLIVAFRDCLFDIIFIVFGRHLDREESVRSSFSFFESGDVQCLLFIQLISTNHARNNKIIQNTKKI